VYSFLIETVWEKRRVNWGSRDNPPPLYHPTTLPYSPLLFLIVLRHLARVSAHGPTYARARDQPIPDPMDDGYNINKSSPEDGIRNQKEKRDAFLAV
jgi:hypothetical protein